MSKISGKDIAKETGMDIVEETAGDLVSEIPFVKTLGNLVKRLHQKSVNDRFEKWVDHVFDGQSEQEATDKLNDPEAADLMIGVLRRLQTDDESAKTLVFAEAYKLLLGDLFRAPSWPESARWEFLDALTTLRLEDLANLCKWMDDADHWATAIKDEVKGVSDIDRGRQEWEHSKNFWDTATQPGTASGPLANRFITAGLLSHRNDRQPAMPTPLASTIRHTLRTTIYEALFHDIQFKPRMNFNAVKGQYEDKLPAPKEGWTRKDFGFPEI